MRQRDDRNFGLRIAVALLGTGAILSVLSIAGMRMAYRRAYTEMAAHCRQVGVLTVDGTKYFCAPVARVERATPTAVAGLPPWVTQL